MCGIAGSYAMARFDVARALEAIRHRGPDGNGLYAHGDAVHGHVRLALVDLTSASAQPFSRDGALLSFVGEVWNYRELRAELTAQGREFRTTGDTEVLAAALNEWGPADALPRLEGMFAFAYSWADRTIVARDRFGKVPLYLHRQPAGEGWAWSSERKGLVGLAAAAVEPGTFVDLGTGRVTRWYEVPDWSSANAPIELLLEAGVERRLNADAPLCCLVSGGLDSAAILTIARRHRPDVAAFCAAIEGRDSQDLAAAQRLCGELGVRLEVVRVREPTADDLAAAALAIETPMKAQVEIAALCIPLAAAIASNGFKACLSGEAADELFGGYGSMCIKGSRADDAGWREIRLGQVRKMARGNFIRCNKAFMARGVECRLPFMERSLVETVLAMPKADCPPGKRALKDAAARAGVPGWVVRRSKETFQGGAGADLAAAGALGDPKAFYRAEVGKAYGRSAL